MKQQSFRPFLVMLSALLLLSACEKDPTEEIPGNLPPQQQLPNPLPANALVKQLWQAENDHETFTYNTKGQVTQKRFQYQYVEGDPTQIRSIVYDFQYDAADKPIRINTTGGYAATYTYEGDRIKKTQELYPNGTVAKEVSFVYADGRIIREYWGISDSFEDTVTIYKHDFSYDARGNLNKIEMYRQMENFQYQLLETVEYSDFDDNINPTSWTMRYPFLPQLRYQFNNPRKEVRTPSVGEAQTTTFAYEYNAAGLPVVQRVTRPSGYVSVIEYKY